MRGSQHKIVKLILPTVLILSLLGNAYQYWSIHQDTLADVNIVGTYCTENPAQSSAGTYLAITKDMTYCLYTQGEVLSEGNCAQYGESEYRLTPTDGKELHALLTKDKRDIFTNGGPITSMDKYDSIPFYIGPH